MTESASPTTAFRAARDLLLRYRDHYDAARREFTWPELDEFNWALDWFDVIAAEHPDRIGLRIVAEDEDTSLTYADLADTDPWTSMLWTGGRTELPGLAAPSWRPHPAPLTS